MRRPSSCLALLFALAACSENRGTGGARFALSVSPSPLTLAPLATATATVTVTRSGDFTGAIDISLEGLPGGVGAAPLTIAASSSTGTLTFRNRRLGNPLTNLAIRVRGTSGAQNTAADFAINVQCPATGQQLGVLAGAPGGAGSADDARADARFDGPVGLTGDGAGNLYVADTFNDVIRKVDVGSGKVTTVAGSPGAVGASDGTGSDALFRGPFAVTRAGGSLFVADTFNHLIRKIDLASGAVTTFAGAGGEPGASDGPAAAARFNLPGAIAAAEGSLFVADTGNHTIRKIDIASGEVATLAGWPGEPGSADGICDLSRFRSPGGVAVDGRGNLFVADTGNHTIRKIVIATEAVTTFSGAAGQAGSAGGVASARFNGPTGLASDGRDLLFVADTENQQVRSISISSGEVVTVWGAGSPVCLLSGDPGRLCFPRGVAVEGGTLFVANTAGDDIRSIALEDLFSGANGTFHGVAGLPAHPGSADGTGASARFNFPQLVAFDGDDTLYVPDAGNSEIRKVSLSSGEVSTVAGSRDFRVCCADGVGPAASFGNPGGVAVDGQTLYVADTFADIIRKIDLATRQVTTIAGVAGSPSTTDGVGTAARFFEPTGIVADGRGHLYVAELRAVRAIDLATLGVTTLAGADFNSPQGLALDGAGNLFVADTGNHIVRRIVIGTGAIATVAGQAGVPGSSDGIGAEARFNLPTGLAFDGQGGLYVSDLGGATVRRLAIATGEVSTVLGQPGVAGVKPGAAPARLNQPAGLAVIGPGQLAIADSAEQVILTLR